MEETSINKTLFNVTSKATIPLSQEETDKFGVTPSYNISFDLNISNIHEHYGSSSSEITEYPSSTTESQEVSWREKHFGTFVSIYEDQPSTPIWIFVLNFFLVIVLMVVISIAVYPAVKNYCDSTFFSNNIDSSRYWVEDNEEIVSVLTSNIPDSSFALITPKADLRAEEGCEIDDSSSSCSVDIFTGAQSELTRLTASTSHV